MRGVLLKSKHHNHLQESPPSIGWWAFQLHAAPAELAVAGQLLLESDTTTLQALRLESTESLLD